MSGVEAEAEAKGGNVMVGTGGFGFGGDVDGSLGGRVYGRDRDFEGQLVKLGEY